MKTFKCTCEGASCPDNSVKARKKAKLLDKLTSHYRKSELEQIQPNQHGFKSQVQVVGIGGKTKWLSITDEELKALKKLLTGGK